MEGNQAEEPKKSSGSKAMGIAMIVIGSLVAIGTLSNIGKLFEIMRQSSGTSNDAAYAYGYLFATVAFGALAFYLIRRGSKNELKNHAVC